MKVEEIMSKGPVSCTAEDDVEVAAEIMRRLDTGIVPVTKDLTQPSKLLGVVTDRDLCLGVVGTGKERTSVRVGELMSTKLSVCRPADTAEQVLARMARGKLRRLPVVNRDFELIGIVSLADIIRHKAVKDTELCRTMAAISRPAKAGRAQAKKAKAA
jgi:CBS domain-containing protein